MTISQFLNTRKSYGYKPVLSLVPRLSTWRYPQSQLGRGQLSIDSRRMQLLMDICCRARAQQQTSCTSLLLSMDTRDRRTDRRTPDRYIDAYCMLCGLRQKSEPVCLSVCLFLCSLFAAAVFSRTKLNLACGILYAPGGQEGFFQRHRATPRAPLDPNDRCFLSVAEAAWRKWAVVNW